MTNPDTKCLGRYEILGELGRGAMGVVYKARDPQIDRLVAVKTISLVGQEPEMVQEYLSRFKNEAQAAGRLHHPGIVSVFDVGGDAENLDPFIVLEYVPGEALNRVLAREKKLPLEHALQLAEEIAEALDYAHAQGVTHRDIKPANILITQDGHAKIADFGIAKLNLAHFTLPGKVLGTPAYMAPEQLSGEATDGRADLFSLGVILYAMVAGHSPFQGNSATTVCFKVANREPVMPSVLDLKLPRELDAVIAIAMAKNPEDRYQRGADFAADLRQLHTVKAGGTTTSLQMAAGGSRQTTRRTALTPERATGIRSAVKLVRGTLNKPLAKGLTLVLLALVLLVVIALQSKLLPAWQEGATWESVQPQPVRVQPARVQPAQVQSAPFNQASGHSFPANASSVNQGASLQASTPIAQPQAAAPKASVKTPRKHATQVIASPSMVELAIRHQFKQATLTIWLDDQIILTRALHGGAQRHLAVFGGVHGVESETLKAPSGRHVLRFQVQTADEAVDLSKTISADLIGGNDKTLLMTFDKHNTAMHLEWQ